MSSLERDEATPTHQLIRTTMPSSTPKSTISLFDFPPELLIHILSFLPTRSLLAFSRTSRRAHTIAISSLHTLRLGIHPSRVSGIISMLGATLCPIPTTVESAFDTTSGSKSASSRRGSASSSRIPEWERRRDSAFESIPVLTLPVTFPPNRDDYSDDKDDPYKVAVLIPFAASHSSDILLRFHTALTWSILTRHGAALTTLDLTLWIMTAPVAAGIAALPAVRTLSLRTEGNPHVRAMPRERAIQQRKEQQDAWMLLAGTARWRGRVRAVKIEGAIGFGVEQLGELLASARNCRELWLCKCVDLGVEVWRWIGEEWEERKGLEVLGVIGENGNGNRVGGEMNEEALGWIGGLTGLRFLCLLGCVGVESQRIEEVNRRVWGIQEVIPPVQYNVVARTQNNVIEVDPSYIGDDGDDGDDGFALPRLVS